MYKLRSLGLSLALGREAAQRKVRAFVELSTGMVYKADSKASQEADKLKPWSKIAVYKLQAEEELAKIEGYVRRAPPCAGGVVTPTRRESETEAHGGTG